MSVELEIREGAALVTMNRPEARNAIDAEMRDGIAAAFAKAEQNPDVSCIILTGAGGKAFAAGADIAELKTRTGPQALAGIHSSAFRRVADSPLPTIAAIVGYALGGGCELAMACDLRVAGASAKLGQPEVGLGIMAAAGGTYRLPQLVGLAHAKELLFTGAIIDAERARSIGLVNHVVPDDQVIEKAREIAAQIAKNSVHAVKLTKRAVNAWASGGVDAWRSMEDIVQHVLYDFPDKEERMSAFLSRKKK